MTPYPTQVSINKGRRLRFTIGASTIWLQAYVGKVRVGETHTDLVRHFLGEPDGQDMGHPYWDVDTVTAFNTLEQLAEVTP